MKSAIKKSIVAGVMTLTIPLTIFIGMWLILNLAN
jgi:hypothetical protein